MKLQALPSNFTKKWTPLKGFLEDFAHFLETFYWGVGNFRSLLLFWLLL